MGPDGDGDSLDRLWNRPPKDGIRSRSRPSEIRVSAEKRKDPGKSSVLFRASS